MAFLTAAALCLAGSQSVVESGGEGGHSSVRSANGPWSPIPPGTSGVPRAAKHAVPYPSGGVQLHAAQACPAVGRSSLSQIAGAFSGFDSPDWLWADGGVSAPLSDGRVAWFFGDTVRTKTAQAPTTMVSNSMLLSSGGCLQQVLAMSGAPVVPDGKGAGAAVTWPTSVVAVNRGSWDELFVFGVRVQRTTGFWGFTLLGTTLTRFAVPSGGMPKRLGQTQLTEDDPSHEATSWGTATLISSSGSGDDAGMVYIYGTRRVGGRLGRALYVARVPLSKIDDVSAWQYRKADGWGDETQAAPLVGPRGGVSHIVSVFTKGTHTYLVSKIDGDLGDSIGLWRASSPSGPFTLVERLYRPYSKGGHLVRYMPLAHPELGTDTGVLVTMSQNATVPGIVTQDHRLGRPEFLTVPTP